MLLTTLLFPTIANAAGSTGEVGKEQPPAFDRLDNPPTSSETRGFGYLYTVVAGDDLWLIATAHGLSMEALAEANDLEPPYWIYPDDKLWIPAAPAEVKRAPAPTPTPAPTPGPTPAPTVAAAPAAAADQPPAPAEQSEGQAAAPPAETPTETITATRAAEVVAAPAVSGDARLIFDLMNQKRTAAGLSALTWSDQLAAAAQAHAEDCAQRGWGSHVGTDGARLRTRLARVDYYPSWTSENWANAISAESAFNMWYWEGPGGSHYENIMGWNYSEAGVGIARGGWGYYYIVDFGKP